MEKAITHHQPTVAQPVPEQQQTWANSPPLILLLSVTWYHMEYSFGHLGPAVPVASLSNFLSTTFTLCKHWSVIARTLVCCQHLFCHESKTWHHTGYYEENQLCLSQNQYNLTHICIIVTPTKQGVFSFKVWISKDTPKQEKLCQENQPLLYSRILIINKSLHTNPLTLSSYVPAMLHFHVPFFWSGEK